ncbi:uncharacterized protein N7496_008732 [Penicillium cataractarum]|uniref:C2H2-type domain-containing protein n=1 Tax=Penicillium cataractarum TaxID=2100454 RepID=A0A9W9RZK6_9EURO|nr:uncharacterized protein N7496_008732 [Penicillium cataractarum]KAJ5368972.1 hypothetical protein N7496_008732 [Penicillium cataractarum]
MPPSLPRRRKKLDLECNLCGKRYTKREHLQRHERIRTLYIPKVEKSIVTEVPDSGDKPFTCPVCGRCFARQDVLNRHSRVHQDDSHPELRTEDIREDTSISSLSLQQQQPCDPSYMNQSHETLSLEDCSSLLWPDSEGLLQNILAIDSGIWNQPASLMPQTLSIPPSPFQTTSAGQGISPSSCSSIAEDGERAIQSLSGIINETFCNVTAPSALAGLTSRFLDSSLHMFFRFIVPMFPVIHQPTFIFRDCPPPLLLNAIALGALFLGTKDANLKADALWQLAHTAVATSWHTMIQQKRPYDSCNGVCLVQTMLLSQIYAALSNNRTLRTTSQVFHGLALFWASHCGMYEGLDHPSLPSPDANSEIMQSAWYSWISQETRLRTLLGLYIVDGVVSQFSGNPTFARHMANPLTLPSDDAVFNASTAQEWIQRSVESRLLQSNHFRFCDVFHALFSKDGMNNTTSVRPEYGISLFHHKVILEGIRSLVADANRTKPVPVGVPSKQEIGNAVIRLREQIIQNQRLSSPDEVVAMLQWHTICLDLVVSTARGTRRMCALHGIPQRIFGGDSRIEQDIDPRRWAQSKNARIALLHASQIQELATSLPLGMAYDINVPGAVFAAATTYSAFALAGAGKVVLPPEIDWVTAVQAATIDEKVGDPGPDRTSNKTLLFVNDGVFGKGLLRDLSYELTSIRSLLRSLSLQWSVAQEMEQVVGAWIERMQ